MTRNNPALHLLLTLKIFLFFITPSFSADQNTTISNIGLQLPETIIHDEKKDLYLISNINASPVAKDDNGFISLMNPDGTIKELKWIDGGSDKITLHAPKGMTIHDDKLYIADIDTIRIFDNKTGAQLQNIEIKGTTFLNDIVVKEDGTILVSESAVIFNKGKFNATNKDAIYKVTPDGKVELWKSGTDLGQPNGMEIINTGELSVVTRKDNRLYILNDNGEVRKTFRTPGKILDGIIQLPGRDFLITSWQTKSIYRIKGGKITTEIELPVPAANLGYDKKRKTLLLPILLKNQVTIVKGIE